MSGEVDKKSSVIVAASPAAFVVETGKWIGLKWGPVGLLVMVIILIFTGVIYFLVKFMDAQNAERREDKATIIAMTATVTKVAADSADSNDKLSKSIDDLRRTIDRRDH